MKLLIINDSFIEKVGPHYYSAESWLRFPQHMAAHCEKVTLWMPVEVRNLETSPPRDAWRVELGNLRIEHNDNYDSFAQFYRLWPRRALTWRKRADRLIKEHDAVILRLPSPMVSIIPGSARRQGKPLIYMVVGNIETQSDRIITNSRLKSIFWSILAKFLVLQEKRCSKHAALIYVYSNELARRYRTSNDRVRLIRTPHITQNELINRANTCQSHEVKLLRVCWFLPSKGLECLLEAVELLVDKGLRVRLEIVGKERYTGYQSKLEAYAEKLGIRERVLFTGWVPFDQIGDVYERSDIQVISSIAEGFPRCIVEGFAKGLPLVSTTIGGCADALTNEVNALLVPPEDPMAMADAVERIIKDDSLRRRLIKDGYEVAHAATFETLGMQVLNEIRGVVYGTQNHMLRKE